MISKTTARAVLEAAVSTGGDYGEIYLEDTSDNSIGMIDGAVETAVSTRSHGAGVRVLCGAKSAYAFTADTSEEALIATARAAAAAISGGEPAAPAPFTEARYGAGYDVKFLSVPNSDRTALLTRATAAAKSYSPEITRVSARYYDVEKNVCIINTNGVWAYDCRPRTRIMVEAVASNGSDTQTGMKFPGLGMGFEAYRELIDPEAAGNEAARCAVTMLHAPECPGGFVPVVIEGGFGGLILHEACVHSLEATSVARGNSEFCGKLGQKVASDIVTAVDDGTMKGEWGTIGIDDEGTLPQRNVLIENGILKTYLFDMLGKRRMEHPLTGSSRRQDYTFQPTSRMTNTFFAPGKDDESEMIATMGEGLFASAMGGGSVNPLTGEFNFAVKEAYWVRDGKILCPVRGATLVGRGTEVLTRIDRIGGEKSFGFGQGICGSLSGSVPTNCGQPRIRVTGITVGGKGGKL